MATVTGTKRKLSINVEALEANNTLTLGSNAVATQSWVTSTIIDGAPDALNTLNELAAAINDTSNYASTVTAALGNRLRIDAAQGLNATQQSQGRSNLGLGTAATSNTGDFAASTHNHDSAYWRTARSVSLTGSNPFDDAKTETRVTGTGNYVINYTGASAQLISSATGGSASIFQIGAHYNGSDFYMRTRTDSTNWQTWKKLWHNGNFDPAAKAGTAVFTNDANGLTPASGGGTTKYLRADGTWAVPPDSNTWRPVDDTPVNGVTTESISSNWAYDHVNASNPHGTTAADVGAAPTSHNHDGRYMRMDTDTHTTGGIEIRGSLSRGTYTTASQYHTGADNIVLKGNASGISGIFFESEKDGTNINHASDFGFIQYHAYGTGTSGEANELVIGVSNDADDHVILNAPNVNGLKFRTGASATDYTIWHEGNFTPSSYALSNHSHSNYLTTTGKAADSEKLDGLDSGLFWRRTGAANATVGGGWMTVASCGSGRHSGEVIVTDGESSDHSFIRIHWMRSYADSNFTVLNCGGHANRITGARVLYATADNTYGEKLLQVYVTVNSNYYVRVTQEGDTPNFSTVAAVTPVIENSKTGYALHGNELTGLENSSLAAEEGISVGGTIYTNSHGTSANWKQAHDWGNHADAGYAAGSHTHDDRYYTETEVNNLLGGKANSSHEHDRVFITDSRGAARLPSYYNDRYAQWDFQNTADTGAGGDGWHAIQTIAKWASFDPSHKQEQLVFTGGDIKHRVANSDTEWGEYKTLIDSSNVGTYAAPVNHTHDEYQPAGSYAASNHNHTYNVNDAWLRDNGDNANFKIYGNSRQIAFRTDGTSEYSSGVGGYPFVWMYGGDASGNRRMILNSSGQLWLSNYGWLHDKFADINHNHNTDYYTKSEVLTLLTQKADTAHSHDLITERPNIQYGTGFLQWTDLSGVGGSGLSGSQPQNPFSDWHHHLIMNHANGSGYYVDLAFSFHNDRIHFRRKAGADPLQWRELIHSGNIGTQTVASANVALSMQWNNILSKPSSFTPSAHTHTTDEIVGLQTELDLKAGKNGGYGDNFYVNALYYDDWVRNHTNNNGMYWSNTGWHLYVQDNDDFLFRSGSNSSAAIRFNTNGVSRGYLYHDNFNNIGFLDENKNWKLKVSAGGTTTASGDVVAFSDRRLKENIETIPNALEKVEAMRGVTFTRKDTGKESIGLIAQEVEEVIPEVVNNEGEYKGIAYGNLVGVLIEAVKELSAEVKELKAKLGE